MFDLYLSFLFLIFLLPPILSSPTYPNSRRYLCVKLQKRTLRKNRHELSLRLARNLMRSHRCTRAFRYHPHPTILHCASRVSNTCSKQSARGSFMHRGKIKRLSPSPSVTFPLVPLGTRFAIDYKLAAKFISRMPPHHPTKGDFTSCSRFPFFFQIAVTLVIDSIVPPRPLFAEKIVCDFAISPLSHLPVSHVSIAPLVVD